MSIRTLAIKDPSICYGYIPRMLRPEVASLYDVLRVVAKCAITALARLSASDIPVTRAEQIALSNRDTAPVPACESKYCCNHEQWHQMVRGPF